MNTLALDGRTRLPTIESTRKPVEEYWESYAPNGIHSTRLDDVLDPLDGYLLTLFLNCSPEGIIVVDLASAVSQGATTAAILNNPSPRKVLAWTGSQSNLLAEALREYAQEVTDHEALELVSEADPPSNLNPRRGLIVLLDAKAGDRDQLITAIDRWSTTYPDAVFLVLGIGSIGTNGAADSLVKSRAENCRIWLARELADPLFSSQLAIHAPIHHAFATLALDRMQQLFSGNIHYLDLLWTMNRSAIIAGGADLEAMQSHPSAAPVMAELHELRRQLAHEREELRRLRDRLARTETALAAHSSSFQGDSLSSNSHASSDSDPRASSRVRIIRKLCAPDGTWRHRTVTRSRRAVQLWRVFGTWYVIRRVFRRDA